MRMQKFVIVSFISEPPADEFTSTDWPLHMTIVRPFQTDLLESVVIETLRPFYEQTVRIKVTGKSNACTKKACGCWVG